MAVTLTPAADRGRRQHVWHARRPGTNQLLLALASIVGMLAIGLAYAGRAKAAGLPGWSPGSAINLATVADARELEPALALMFANAAEREFAAAQLFSYVRSRRDAGDELPNVGAIAGATVPADLVRESSLVEYHDRLRQASDRAESAARPPPSVLPLFTPADLAAIKPALVVRTPQDVRRLTWIWAGVYLAAIWVVALVWRIRRLEGDYLLLAAAHLLTAVGFAVLLSRADPLRDTALFVRYTQGVAVGCVAFALLSLLDFRRTALAAFSYLPVGAALALSALLIVFGSGPAGSDAKVNMGPVQPVEAIRLLLGLFLAGYFARRWELLRQIRGRAVRGVRLPDWLHLPRADYVLPVAACIGAALLFFALQKDLGPALFVSCVFLAIYAVARGRAAFAVLGFAVLAAGFSAGYVLNVSATLSSRVHMWQSAWDNGARGGDQVAQAIWAMSTGGLRGTGLGLGDTRYVPAGHTDLVLAAIGEELGFVGLLAVAGVFALIAVRGLGTALRAATDYGFFLASILTLFVVVPVLIMAAGTLGVVPLTGVVTPFLSYGGSAMVANFAALGMLAAIHRAPAPAPLTAPFRRGVVSLGAVLGVAALGLGGVLLDVQVIHADDYAVRPHLGVHADGVRRWQYNPRVLDAAERVVRGTIFDRSGLPMATSDPDRARRAAAEYRALEIDLAGCDTAAPRCYPLGGAAFHLLGDAATRRNWSATNSSYVERDLQDRLRGFDGHRELLPLVRHRYQPDHPAAAALLARERDVVLTIDAPFQVRVARVLAKYAARSATGRAAAVVIDPDTGDLLATVSYPVPASPGEEHGAGGGVDTLLDRARYGLYPPGSAFKLVTAAAALRLDAGSGGDTFMCTHQAQGRVGARIPGYGAVRDDVLNTVPHGTIGLRDAIVRSCNAYFAQLAVRLGPHALLETADLLGVSVARGGSADRLRDTLPHAGYGQGEVVATPLRMARVAAAIASDGVLREPRLERSAPGATPPSRLLSPDAAALLAGYLREAVVSGTGRSLGGHPWRIAGKTGTAEVAGASSHAWFVGFAPHGKAEKRIAFAILIENAGYGGQAAAPAAGEIVTAAAASGLIH